MIVYTYREGGVNWWGDRDDLMANFNVSADEVKPMLALTMDEVDSILIYSDISASDQPVARKLRQARTQS